MIERANGSADDELILLAFDENGLSIQVWVIPQSFIESVQQRRIGHRESSGGQGEMGRGRNGSAHCSAEVWHQTEGYFSASEWEIATNSHAMALRINRGKRVECAGFSGVRTARER